MSRLRLACFRHESGTVKRAMQYIDQVFRVLMETRVANLHRLPLA